MESDRGDKQKEAVGNRIQQIAEQMGKDLTETGMHRAARLASIALTEHYMRTGGKEIEDMEPTARDAFLKGLQEIMGAKMVEDHLYKDETGKMQMKGVPVGMMFCAMEQMAKRIDLLESRLGTNAAMLKVKDKKVELLEKRLISTEHKVAAAEKGMVALEGKNKVLEAMVDLQHKDAMDLLTKVNTLTPVVNELMSHMLTMGETVKTLSALAKKNEE